MNNVKDNVVYMSGYTKHFKCHLCKTSLYYKEKDSFFDILKKHSQNCSWSYSISDDLVS